MSVQFTEPDLEPTYQSIISGGGDYDWAMFNQSGNELKVQATGTGLEDLEEEFMDGRWAPFPWGDSFEDILLMRRIQYAFARVNDPSVSWEIRSWAKLTVRAS